MSRRFSLRGRIRKDLADPLFRNAYALLANALGTAALGFAYWVLAARLYSPTFVGASSALIASLLLASTVAQLNLGGALARFLPRAGPASSRLVFAAYGVCGTLAVVLALAASPWLSKMAADLGFGRRPAVFLITAAVGVWCIFALQDHILTGLRQAAWVPVENGVFGVLKIVLLVALASTLPDTGILVSWIAPMALLLLPVNALIFGRLLPRHSRAETAPEKLTARGIGRFVALDYLGALFNLAATQLLPVLVAARIGAEANGYFYVAWVVMLTLDFALVGLTSSLTVEGSREKDKLPELVGRFMPRLALGMAATGLMIFIAAPGILAIFGPEYAQNATLLLRLLAIGMLPRAVVVLWLGIARVRSQVTQIVAVQGAIAVLVLGLAALLIGNLNIAGVGVAYLVGQGTVALFLLPKLREVLAGRSGEATPVRRTPLRSLQEVSVVVPVRNAEALIDECLRSVTRARPAEIIVVDGLSTDRTLEIAGRYPVSIISDEGRGLPAARTLGAQAARTPYIALIDADIVLNDGDLQDLLDEFIEGGYVGLQGGLRSVPAPGYWSKALANHHRHGFSRSWFGVSLAIFQRDTLLAVGFDERFGSGEDIDLRLRLADMKARTAVSKVTSMHRFGPGFKLACGQWAADGAGLVRVMRKRGRRSYWLWGLPTVSAAWGIFNSILRLQPQWIPYFLCYWWGNHWSMAKELVRPADLPGEPARATRDRIGAG